MPSLLVFAIALLGAASPAQDSAFQLSVPAQPPRCA
jgi:hypothetical protein